MNAPYRDECTGRDVAVGWAVHALEPEEEADFARHLPRCAPCTERVRSTEAVAALLGQGVRQLDPPPRLRAAILAAARAQPPSRAPLPVSARDTSTVVVESAWSSPRLRRVLMAAAAVSLVAFGAGWAGSQATGAGTAATQSALPALSNPTVHSTPITGAQTKQVMAVVLSDGTSTSVVPVAMAAAPTGEAYWLWGTGGAGGAPVALGRVTVGAGAAADLQARSSMTPASFSGYALSVESDKGVPVMPSSVIGSSGTI